MSVTSQRNTFSSVARQLCKTDNWCREPSELSAGLSVHGKWLYVDTSDSVIVCFYSFTLCTYLSAIFRFLITVQIVSRR